MSRVREAYDGVGGGEGVDTDKAKAWGIERLWFESTDPRVTKTNMAAVRSRGVGVGIKMNGTGYALATALDSKLTELGFGTTTGPFSCGVMADDETHQWDQTIILYDTFRKLRWSRYFIITIEPWQAPAIPPEFIQRINPDQNFLLAVQAYMDYQGDPLYPAYAPAAKDQLERAGVLKDRLTIFNAVKANMQFPYGWEGLWWTFDNLPAAPGVPL